MGCARSVSIQRAAERKVGNSPCYGCAERHEACRHDLGHERIGAAGDRQ